MTSDPERVYVWTWLPGSSKPVVAGVIQHLGGHHVFRYGRSYLARNEAIALGPELPLTSDIQEPAEGLSLAGCLRDGSPDAWGRRVIDSQWGLASSPPTELAYMLASGSNRFGALDFQASPTEYIPRESTASLDELHEAVMLIEERLPLSPALAVALQHGTSIGGARPKVLIRDEAGGEYLAKFSSTSDRGFPVVNAEGAALALAAAAGISAAPMKVVSSLGREVLLVERFDRGPGGQRKHTLSALTLLELDEIAARYATYWELAERLNALGATDGRPELFARIVFNVAISNNDDHARNHAVLWDGRAVRLSPAYDLAPGMRARDTSYQAMAIDRDGERSSSFATCLAACHLYGLDTAQAREIIDRVEASIRNNWDEAADEARLTRADKKRLWGHQFLHPATRYGYEPTIASGWSGS